MSTAPQRERAPIEWFRSTAPYINRHRGAVFVIMLPGEALSGGHFERLSHDMALLSSLGVRLVLVHGARPQVEERLRQASRPGRLHKGIRITGAEELALVREAVGAARIEIEAALSASQPNSPMQGAQLRVLGGNFVRARPLGVIDGIDHGYTGRVRRIDGEGIRSQLAGGAIVLVPTLGYSATGEIFNLSLEDVAVRCAVALAAEKLLLLGAAPGVYGADGELLRQVSVEQVPEIATPDAGATALLAAAANACLEGVDRCHILSYVEPAALLEELFTHDGVGTLVTRREYERARPATMGDVGGLLELIRPLEREGILRNRPRELLESELDRFRVLERDGRVIACAALHPYPLEGCAEIACVVTHPDYRGGQRASRLLQELEDVARSLALREVFVATTQASHWFLEKGFVETGVERMPRARRAVGEHRNAKVFFKTL